MSEKLVMITCYDRAFSKAISTAQCVDYFLVGDSLGMVIYGEKSTAEVPLRWMLDHTRAVKRGLEESTAQKKPLIVGDMPAQTYRSPKEALETAVQFKRAGADLVKLEGPKVDEVRALVDKDFRVVTHLGLTPQTADKFRLQAKAEDEANQLLDQARLLQEAGSELLVLEMIPAELARRVTEELQIPTIGIGAGPHCSGQVLVLYDMLGMDPDFSPKFLRRFSNASEFVQNAVQEYSQAVRSRDYPSSSESYS